MTNHAHFIAVPKKAESLARCCADAHVRYTRRINKWENRKGHLWQSRFDSSVLDEAYLRAAARYVERNPVRAGMVKTPWEYRWSSVRLYMDTTKRDPLVSGNTMLREVIGDWGAYVRQEENQGFIDVLRREVVVSRPAGNESFIRRLEKCFDCMLRRQKVGRPSKRSE